MCIYYIYLKKHNFLVQRYINIHKYKVKIQMLNIFNIGYEKSFSDDLVEGIFEKFGKDSSYLSKIKIFLPNRTEGRVQQTSRYRLCVYKIINGC